MAIQLYNSYLPRKTMQGLSNNFYDMNMVHDYNATSNENIDHVKILSKLNNWSEYPSYFILWIS